MIGENYRQIRNIVPSHVRIVVVSKTHDNDKIMEVYREGQRLFGENKVQELVPKYIALPKDIEWHMIGHLQSNKVKYIAPFISMIHSVDSVNLLEVINKEATKHNRKIPCLLQIHIAQEETKFGFEPEQVLTFLSEGKWKNFSNVIISGLMGMATYTNDTEQIRNEFKGLANLFKKIKQEYFANSEEFNTLSMGMSNDYQIAIEEGSNMVRIGSLIFGERKYQ